MKQIHCNEQICCWCASASEMDVSTVNHRIIYLVKLINKNNSLFIFSVSFEVKKLNPCQGFNWRNDSQLNFILSKFVLSTNLNNKETNFPSDLKF